MGEEKSSCNTVRLLLIGQFDASVTKLSNCNTSKIKAILASLRERAH